MKKINIVKENKDFNRIIAMNNCYKDKNIVIYVARNDLNKYRFGVSVGTKIGHAHIRNYYKRIIRNICDKYKNIYQNNLDYIIIVRKNCLNCNFSDIETSFLNLMKRINSQERNCSSEEK